MTSLSSLWPLFGLSLKTPRLELRPVTDGDIPAAVAAAKSGIHDPGTSPFSTPWTEAPGDELGAGMARWYWRCRAEAAAWNSASLGVSRSLGYELNGITRNAWGTKVETVQHVRLTPETFKRPDWTLQVEGHEAAARFLEVT
jgi:hypothetical protein